jgi:hypothetical protein
MMQLILIILTKRKKLWQKILTNVSIILTNVSVAAENG